MKLLSAFAVFVFAGWPMPVCSQDAKPGILTGSAPGIGEKMMQTGPAQTSGIEAAVLKTIPLQDYFDSLEGSQFRMREVVMLPGGRIAVHSHDTRPAMVVVLEGEFLEHRSDSEEPVLRRKGDTFFETQGLVHWSENVSSSPVRALAIDVLPENPD